MVPVAMDSTSTVSAERGNEGPFMSTILHCVCCFAIIIDRKKAKAKEQLIWDAHQLYINYDAARQK